MSFATTLVASALAAAISILPNETVREIPGCVDTISGSRVTVVDAEGRSSVLERWDSVVKGQNVRVVVSDNGTPNDAHDDYVVEVKMAHRYFLLGYISANNSGRLTIDTEDGNRWEVYRPDAVGYLVGTEVCLIVNNNFTPNDARDDIIQRVFYAFKV